MPTKKTTKVAEPKKIKVLIHPGVAGEDLGEGGVGRVIRAQIQHLPALGIELVDDPAAADVIACHILIPSQWLKLYPRKKFVVHHHGAYYAEHEWPDWAHKANHAVMEGIRVADAVTSPSRWVTEIIARQTNRHAETIYHGVDLDEWAPLVSETAPDYILWDKNRVDPVCDPGPLMSLASALKKMNFVSTYWPDAQPPANVKVVGPLPYQQMIPIVKRAAMYLATSRETFGIATVQALSAGVPVVGFDWAGQAEMGINEAKAGILVAPGDHTALVNAVLEIRREYSVFAANAAELGKRWSWERPMQQYASLYRELAVPETGPRTSVVVTSYNLGAYLPACLDSVLAQTDPDWECIVVDDCSTDGSLAIAKSYAERDPRVTVVKPPQNLYQAGARNYGIARSNGRYILPLDADDMLPPTSVALQAKALDEDRSLAVVYGHVLFVGEDGHTRLDYGGPPGRSGWPVAFRWEAYVNEQNPMPYSSMFRREAWEDTGGYRRRCRTADDPDFWCRVSSYGFRPKKITDNLTDTLIYRVRSGSMSHVEAPVHWSRWFGWHGEGLWHGPGAAVSDVPLLIPSLTPPVFSVVIPVGPGHEELFMDAVDSLEAQTNPWWECIVVWDSPEPPPVFRPAWINLIQSGGIGVARARNLGAASAKGRYLFFLDADDYLQPACLETFEAVARKNPEHILYSDFWEDPTQGVFKVWAAPNYDAKLLLKGQISAVTQAIPRALWERHHLAFDSSLPSWEDWAMQLQCAEVGICSLRIPVPLWTYRKHTGYRREANMSSFATGKAAIEERFGQYWTGEELMACGCKGKGVAAVVPSQSPAGSPVAQEGMTLIAYKGAAMASVEFKGPSGQRYSFSAGDLRYVFDQDVEHFMRYEDFTMADAAPVTIAEGPELISMNPAGVQ